MEKEPVPMDMLLKLKQSQESGDFGLENRAKKNDPLKKNFTHNNSQNRQSKQSNTSNNNNSNNHAKKQLKDDPTTPYNFVGLNNFVVRPPLNKYLSNVDIKNSSDMQQGFKQFIKDTTDKKYSGYFEVTINNLTPLYIGGANNKFFSDGENICIPGSSLRGCIKNIFKIITSSSMRAGDNPDVTDKHLYFRSFTSSYHAFRDSYLGRMVDTSQKNKKGKSVANPKAEAGFLVHEGKNYFICPAQWKKQKLSYYDKNTFSTCTWGDTCANVYSGKMPDKKHFYKIFNPRWNEKLQITDETLRDYRNDKNRKGFDLLSKENRHLSGAERTNRYNSFLKGSQKYDFIMPCFYVAKENIVQHFGSNPYYRIPYEKSIAEHIPKNLKSSEIDFTDAVFGNKENWSSRVFFEDSYLQGNSHDVFYPKRIAKILATPNPTSFQFYLEPYANGKAGLWDDSSCYLRGYKFYWHKKMDWFITDNEEKPSDNFIREIAPIKENQTFKGKIRFQNLDITELGALATVLNLSEQKSCYFKLGMGKPIGMGTIKIASKLFLQENDFYTTLFDNTGFYKGSAKQNPNQFIDKFTDYLKNNMPKESWDIYKDNLFDMYALMSIKYMDENNAKINKLTKYMNIAGKNNKHEKNIINERIILPNVKELTQKFNDPKIK